MIPLQFSKLDSNEKNRIKENFCKPIYESIRKYERGLLNDWVRDNIPIKVFVDNTNLNQEYYKNIYKNNPFLCVMVAEYEVLEAIVNLWDYKKLREEFGDKRSGYLVKTVYKEKFNKKAFAELINEKVCPYCNRNYVFNTEKLNSCQLDHFFEKSAYPLLAVSFCNLTPVCPACNYNKGTEKLSYSPHNVSYSADELMTFTYDFQDYDITKRRISIKNKHMIMEDNLRSLDLEALYQSHNDVADDLYDMAQSYPKDYIDNIASNLGVDYPTAVRWTLGVYYSEEDYRKRPLSKLVMDLSREFHLVR